MSLTENKVNVFIAYFVLLTAFLFFRTDSVAGAMSHTNLFRALTVHLITNPEYLIIVVGLISFGTNSILKGFLSGIALGLAIDIISLPHLPSSGITGNDAAVFTNIDVVFAQVAAQAGISYGVFYAAYYLIIPLALLYFSITLLGYSGFYKKIMGLAKP